MKKVEVVKANEVTVAPFVLQNFTASEIEHIHLETVGKKELKILAQELGLAYDENHIAFTKKLINAYIKKR